MKHKLSLAFLILIFFSTTLFSMNIKSTILYEGGMIQKEGLWTVYRKFDRSTSDNVPQTFTISYHFHEDGEVIIRDHKWNTEAIKKWTISGKKLIITNRDGKKRKVGVIKFQSDDQFTWNGMTFKKSQ